MLFSRAQFYANPEQSIVAKCLCPLLLCCAGYSSLVVQMYIRRFLFCRPLSFDWEWACTVPFLLSFSGELPMIGMKF
jgi:hypothetical protein